MKPGQVQFERWLRRICATIFLLGMTFPSAAEDGETLELSPLGGLVADYVATHPAADIPEVAAFANEGLMKYGINYDFYMLKEPPDRTVVLQAGSRRLLRRTPDDIDLGACGEFWATLPAVRSNEQWIDVIHRGERLRVPRPDDLEIETMTVYSADQQTVLSKLDVPDYFNWPITVLPEGRGVVVHFVMYRRDQEVKTWWKNVRARHTHVTDEYPHLRLQVDADGVRFIDDPAAYADEPRERIKEFPNPHEDDYLARVRFPRSGLVVEYRNPCT